MHIRVGDQVKVMIGKDKRAEAKVLRVMREEGLILVEGVNQVYKHMRKSQQNPKGGRLQKEMPVKISNVQLICPQCGQPSRTGVKFHDDGSKYRFCKKCKAESGQISPSREKLTKSK